MKKGLLSLLALALTVVGCQNYDDQFAELTSLIEDLQTEVEGLPDVTSQVTALQNTVNGLATAAELSNLSTTVAGLATSSDLTTGLAGLQTQIDALVASLADVADADDIAAINAELSDIQADLDELLEANAVINQDITINNMATLEYVESLISTATDDPNVIINGAVTIDVDDTDFDSAGKLGRVNAVAAKIATILGNGATAGGFDFDNTTASHSVDFANLAFIDDDADFTGDATFGNLRTITGSLDYNINAAIDLSTITSCGTLTITDGSAVTSVNLGDLTVNGAATAGGGDGHFTFLAATSVDLGKAVTAKVSSPLATAVTVKANTTSVTVETVAEDADINIEGATGEISITGTATTDVFAPNVTTNASVTTNNIASLHMVALTKTATITSGAAAVALGALTSNASGTITLDRLSGAFTAEGLDVTKTLQVSGTSVTIGTVSNTGVDLIVAPNATTVSIKRLDRSDDFELNNTNLPAVTTLNVRGASTAGATAADKLAFDSDLTVTGHAKIVTLNIENGFLNDVDVDGNAALENLTTAGNMNSFTLNNNDDLAAATIGHDHIEGADASYLTVTGNAELESLTTTALNEAGDIEIDSNPVLTRVDLSSIASSLPVAGAYTISITNNRLTGNYNNATAASTTTAYVETVVKLDDMQDLRALNTADAGNSAVSYDIFVEGDWMTLGTGTATATLQSRIGADTAHASTTLSGSYLKSNTFAVSGLLQDE